MKMSKYRVALADVKQDQQQKKKSFWKRLLKWNPWKWAQRARKQDSDKTVESELIEVSSEAVNEADLTSLIKDILDRAINSVLVEAFVNSDSKSVIPRRVSNATPSIGSIEDSEAVNEADLTSAFNADSDKTAESVLVDTFVDSDSKSGPPSPEMTATPSIGSIEDSKDVNEADLTSLINDILDRAIKSLLVEALVASDSKSVIPRRVSNALPQSAPVRTARLLMKQTLPPSLWNR
ncbi:uncharacterized protein LOC119501732 isoform X2 [Sebastes umbrosus]|uniref:uncharacterized protein LOC119501732 isoform X1 n=1 Tax=Sebastes umbrosus TaxID=72105 RepID=UPI0018A0A067|nr:uncharacterized protein LOC119501732 isoform X1 [Sebastes umbrosus]XP_037648231.1 uncharacterized protein LOC119501732 isoform X2 [Sebastes umbrosus]